MNSVYLKMTLTDINAMEDNYGVIIDRLEEKKEKLDNIRELIEEGFSGSAKDKLKLIIEKEINYNKEMIEHFTMTKEEISSVISEMDEVLEINKHDVKVEIDDEHLQTLVSNAYEDIIAYNAYNEAKKDSNAYTNEKAHILQQIENEDNNILSDDVDASDVIRHRNTKNDFEHNKHLVEQVNEHLARQLNQEQLEINFNNIRSISDIISSDMYDLMNKLDEAVDTQEIIASYIKLGISTISNTRDEIKDIDKSDIINVSDELLSGYNKFVNTDGILKYFTGQDFNGNTIKIMNEMGIENLGLEKFLKGVGPIGIIDFLYLSLHIKQFFISNDEVSRFDALQQILGDIGGFVGDNVGKGLGTLGTPIPGVNTYTGSVAGSIGGEVAFEELFDFFFDETANGGIEWGVTEEDISALVEICNMNFVILCSSIDDDINVSDEFKTDYNNNMNELLNNMDNGWTWNYEDTEQVMDQIYNSMTTIQ